MNMNMRLIVDGQPDEEARVIRNIISLTIQPPRNMMLFEFKDDSNTLQHGEVEISSTWNNDMPVLEFF